MKLSSIAAAMLGASLSLPIFSAPLISSQSEQVADYAVAEYQAQMVSSLAHLVSFNTEVIDGQTPDTNPAFIGFKSSLKQLSADLGLDYQDHGYVILIGVDASEPLATPSQKLGIITHGDVQPANAALWRQSPYELDTSSEPGKLIGRGTEDDKGAIVTAMYAMKAIKDKGITLERRLELMVYLAEESDWDPLKAFLATDFVPADINITIDAEYPIVTAEKGWSQIKVTVPHISAPSTANLRGEGSADKPSQAQLLGFSGGAFASQIPQQAKAVVRGLSAAQWATLKADAAAQAGMTYQFVDTVGADGDNDTVTILADGKSAHSSTPEDGVNAVTHLAQLLAPYGWSQSHASLTLAFVHELIGMGLEAEQFGEIGYRDDFMGAMTLAPTVLAESAQGTEITMNLRRPIGKTPELLDKQTHQALANWQSQQGIKLVDVETYWGEPMVMKDAPHEQTLLKVFSHFTGIDNPQPVAIGGSTNSKLFPNALSFGPAMPGVEYTGHSEHEFITQAQFELNLKMYTAAFIELTQKR